MSLPKFSIQQPVFINLLMALIIIAGFCSFISMPKEEWPEVTKNTISVITAYPGASPAEIEELVTRPIEEEVGDLSDIENITSFSYEGRSLVQINFTTSANLDRKLLEVQTEVNKVTDLPQNTEDPEIEKYELLFPLLTVGLVGDGHERELNELAQDLQYDFKKVYGVGEVTLAGNRKKEIRVAVDPARLETFGLSLNDVSTALQSKNLNLPGGSLKTAHREILLRTVGKLTAVKEIEKVIIKKNGRAGHTYIKDIARVTESFEDPRVISRLNGRRGITLSIAQSDVGNIVDIVTELKEIALRYRSRLPAKTGIILANDSSIYLEKRLRILYSNGITGFILVGLSLFLFLGFRPALVTAIGIPIAFCGCILCMAIAGMTINSLTLFAMIVVLGMIVDDAIVVTENAYRYIEQGLPAKEAALRGAREMFWPVTAAVATSMAAFLPLLLMAGTLGKVMRQVPQVVIFALAASVWEAFLILPSHLADIAKPLKRSKHRDTGSFRFQKVQDAYAALLRRVVALRYRAVATIVCAAGLIAVIAGGTLDFVLFPNPDFDIFMLRVETDESTRIEQTAEIAAEAEQFLLELPPEEVLSVKSETGRKQTSVGFEFASNITTIEVRLSDYLERTRSGHEIMDDIRRKLNSLANPGLYTLEVLRLGPPVGRPVAVKVLGDDLEILNRLAGKVAEKLESIQGVKDIEHDFRPGKQEIQIVVDGDRAALYGLDVETIARTIRLAYKGAVATTFNDSNEEIDVVVTFNQVTRNDRGRLLDIKVKNPAGALIPLKNVAAAAHTSGYATIKRFDGKRVITVLADIDPALNTSRTVISEIRSSMAGYMKQFPGYKLTFGGEFENTQKSLASMFQAFGLATFLIYLILATTFKSFTQPLLLMASIPFAVLGVFIGLIVTQTPMGMMSFMGTIALAGIVVNDSIVLIDVINRRIVEAGPDGGVTECLIDACKTRLRPVLLTSITTILGLMPLAMGIFGREFMMTPMAISIVWGLSFSSFLTLLIIPCFYLMLEDAKRWLASLPGMKRRVPATGILDEESQG